MSFYKRIVTEEEESVKENTKIDSNAYNLFLGLYVGLLISCRKANNSS